MRTLAIRLPGVIGPASERNWLSHQVLAAAREGREISVYNAASPYNNAVHVSDLVRFVCILLRQGWRGAEVVTLGAAGMTTVRRAVELVANAFGGKSAIREVTGRRAGFTISSARAIERFGYAPMEIEEMLRRFAAENGGKI